MAARAHSVALVIPAWNEAEAIGDVLAEVPKDAVASDQILVVVGSDTDPTAAVARAHGARAHAGRPRVRRGMLDRRPDGPG